MSLALSIFVLFISFMQLVNLASLLYITSSSLLFVTAAVQAFQTVIVPLASMYISL